MKLFTIIFTALIAFLAYSELDISLKDTGYIANYALPLFTDDTAPNIESDTSPTNTTPLDGVTAQVATQ